MVTQAPVILTICADFNRTVKWAEQRKAHPGYDNFLSFLNAATDALLFTQTFCNLAEAEGLGICYLGTTLEAVVHEETYHDYIPETIDRYYGPKEQLPENRHFVEINHKETLAQIFTDIRYTRKDNEAMSRGMLEALKRQGFLD